LNGGLFHSYVAAAQSHIETVLADLLPQQDAHTRRLTEAMRYSLLGGGKRLRALLVYATGEALGGSRRPLDAPAAAVEMIHAYSLIHDDLPAMDDDDLRRGRPSCHRAFDEGTAILAGDALQALAFEVLARDSVGSPDAARIQMLTLLARAIGTAGMAGGQAIDLEAVRGDAAAIDIELMHRRKTGALIAASVELGAIAAGVASGGDYEALREYGAEIGLAFQIQDDILDVTGDTGTLGKRPGADAALGKPTYPSIFGLDQARAAAVRHRDRALQALNGIQPRPELLHELALFIVARAH
jgi:geranylgeranyl pyrophosphate synthase